MKVADAMDAEPVAVQPQTPIEDVLRIMRDAELSGIPVVNGENRCVGIITEADLVLSGEESDLHLPHYVELFGGLIFLEPLRHFEDRLRKAAAAKARDLMTEDPATIAADAPVAEAARLIARTGHNRIPVVDADGYLAGMITRVDVLEALTRD